MMGRIPDRWDAYSAVGQLIAGTRFLPFKVPLKEVLCRQTGMPKNLWFTPKMLISLLKEQGTELGLVIDLTNTTRYYQPQEFTEEGIGYEKIFTEGHSVPSVAVIQRFFGAVDNFLEENKDNNRVIGVHCTHGLNRTGYLVCRYMIDRLDMKSLDAVTAFNMARGYNIERENYLDDLNGLNGTSASSKPVTELRGGFRSRHVDEWQPTCDNQWTYDEQRSRGRMRESDRRSSHRYRDRSPDVHRDERNSYSDRHNRNASRATRDECHSEYWSRDGDYDYHNSGTSFGTSRSRQPRNDGEMVLRRPNEADSDLFTDSNYWLWYY